MGTPVWPIIAKPPFPTFFTKAHATQIDSRPKRGIVFVRVQPRPGQGTRPAEGHCTVPPPGPGPYVVVGGRVDVALSADECGHRRPPSPKPSQYSPAPPPPPPPPPPPARPAPAWEGQGAEAALMGSGTTVPLSVTMDIFPRFWGHRRRCKRSQDVHGGDRTHNNSGGRETGNVHVLQTDQRRRPPSSDQTICPLFFVHVLHFSANVST